jgi:hypothetical protein
MKSNPILEEVWQIKDQLAAEAGYDIDRFFENLRKWEAEHPQPGPVVNSAEELQQLIVEKERRRAEVSAMSLNNKPLNKVSPTGN